MNLVYGALVFLISFLVLRFVPSACTDKKQQFIASFMSEFVLVSVLGAVFWFFKWGFFAQLYSTNDILFRIFGLALFLAVLVAMKVVNQARMATVDTKS